jgi:hypothetical protein
MCVANDASMSTLDIARRSPSNDWSNDLRTAPPPVERCESFPRLRGYSPPNEAGLLERKNSRTEKSEREGGLAWLINPNTPFSVRRAKARSSSGCESHPATVAPAGSNRSSRGGDEAAEAFGVKDPLRGLASMQAVTRVNAEQASKSAMRKPTRSRIRGRLPSMGKRAIPGTH